MVSSSREAQRDGLTCWDDANMQVTWLQDSAGVMLREARLLLSSPNHAMQQFAEHSISAHTHHSEENNGELSTKMDQGHSCHTNALATKVGWVQISLHSFHSAKVRGAWFWDEANCCVFTAIATATAGQTLNWWSQTITRRPELRWQWLGHWYYCWGCHCTASGFSLQECDHRVSLTHQSLWGLSLGYGPSPGWPVL